MSGERWRTVGLVVVLGGTSRMLELQARVKVGDPDAEKCAARQYAKQYVDLAEVTGKKTYLWLAYEQCARAGIKFPPALRSYFDSVAQNLRRADIADGEDPDRFVGRATGLRPKETMRFKDFLPSDSDVQARAVAGEVREAKAGTAGRKKKRKQQDIAGDWEITPGAVSKATKRWSKHKPPAPILRPKR